MTEQLHNVVEALLALRWLLVGIAVLAIAVVVYDQPATEATR